MRRNFTKRLSCRSMRFNLLIVDRSERVDWGIYHIVFTVTIRLILEATNRRVLGFAR